MRVQANALAPSSVQVTWRSAAATTGVVGFKLFRDGVEVAETVLPGYTDFGLAPEKRYTYTVAAFGLHGNRSPLSAPPAQVATPARAAFCQVELGAEEKGERLTHVTDPDGDTRPAQADGRDCREPATAQDHYFYFAIADGYLFNEAGLTCRLEVTYFDEAGFIGPQFDAVTGAYTGAKRIEPTGGGEWRTAAWSLPACKFANRQNAGADFRLFVGPNRVKVHCVRLLAERAQEWETRK